MNLGQCHNYTDLPTLAKNILEGNKIHYIDGAADDEVTYKRNSQSFNDVDLVPNVLAGVEEVDMSTKIMGQELSMPFYCAPTALQRLFHHEGERAVAKAASSAGTMFGVSSLATVTVEDIAKISAGPKMFQFYFHKDRGLNDALLERAKAAKFNVLALTVDTITGGNRERDLRSQPNPPRSLVNSQLLKTAYFASAHVCPGAVFILSLIHI